MKLGLWLLVAAVAFLWFNHAKKQRFKSRARGTAQADADADGERILACAHCGLHVPASDVLVDIAGASFCCEAHRRLHSQA